MGEYSGTTLDRVFSAVPTPRAAPSWPAWPASDARVTDVAGAFPISLNSTSKHIRVLEGAGLVRRHGAGARAHPEPGRRAAGRGGGMDRALPPVLERPARRARRVRHRPRPAEEAVVTGEYTVTVRREIAAPAEDLFDAWLDAESLGSWLRPGDDPGDPGRDGSACRWHVPHRDGRRRQAAMVHTGTYREIDRPRRLVFTWSSPATQFRDSIVTVTFEPSSNARRWSRSTRSGSPTRTHGPRTTPDGPTSCASSTASSREPKETNTMTAHTPRPATNGSPPASSCSTRRRN